MRYVQLIPRGGTAMESSNHDLPVLLFYHVQLHSLILNNQSYSEETRLDAVPGVSQQYKRVI